MTEDRHSPATKGDLSDLRTELKGDIASLRNELADQKDELVEALRITKPSR